METGKLPSVEQPGPATPDRRPFQFRLRRLLILFVVFALITGAVRWWPVGSRRFLIKHGNQHQLLRAFLGLMEHGREAAPVMREALEDADPQIRAMAAWALAYWINDMGPGAKSLVPALARMLPKSSPKSSYDIRRFSVLALRKLGPDAREAVPGLIESLDFEQDRYPLFAILALGGSVRKPGRRCRPC